MIKARHHWFVYPFFRKYSRYLINRHFRKVYLDGSFEETDRPLLIIANHFSWWDGFFIDWLNYHRLDKRYHIALQEETFKKHGYFALTGAFSIRRNSKSVIESLTYCRDLLADPENLVVFFPQGRFESQYRRPFHFEPGIEWLLKRMESDFRLLFVANQVEYFDTPGPSLFIHYQAYDPAGRSL
jgi:1-acyl-sn-glycerol-3-phosphate acyltransferase